MRLLGRGAEPRRIASMGDPTRWAELYAARREAASRWPDVFRLPVRRTPGRVVAAACRSGAAVLDVGAGVPEPRAGPLHRHMTI